MGTMRAEQETHIHMEPDSDYAVIYTSDTLEIKRMDKRVKSGQWECIKVYKELNTEEVVAKTYRGPKKLLKIHADFPKRRELTEEEREKQREHMKKIQEMLREKREAEASGRKDP